MDYRELKEIASLLEETGAFKCFILDPNSMTEAEIQDELEKAQDYEMRVRLGLPLKNNNGDNECQV